MFLHVPVDEYERLKSIEAASMNLYSTLRDLLGGPEKHGELTLNSVYAGALTLQALAEVGLFLGVDSETGEYPPPRNLV